MAIPVHGDSTVIWIDNICVSILNGAFNEAGIERWLSQVRQSWQLQGRPTHWASVLDMFNWQGRTPECEPLMREGVAWSRSHGLQFRILMMERGSANVFFQLTQKANPVMPAGSDFAVCASHEEAIEQLRKRDFTLSLPQLQGLSIPKPTEPL